LTTWMTNASGGGMERAIRLASDFGLVALE
jgi:hypothetical protein